MDRSGQVLLGKYELTRMLGQGGMGQVWEGEHQLTGRRVAVKILSDGYLSNKKVVARFGREARAASAVQHEGIVEILDQDRTDEGVPFLVMEFLEGESVGQRIKRRAKLPESEALAIMLPLLEALDAAHQAGVIHRDLKPDNVFIMPGARGRERIKILDFGISQKADEIEHRLTQEGSVLGTPHYMSPEQARGEANIDVRVDVYAATVMLYECVVGQVPFDAGNYNALLQIILGQVPTPPRKRGAEIGEAVEQVVLAGLAKRREERPPNARVLRELLLEASLQEDGAQLDRATWRFKSPPPPRNSVLSSLPPPTKAPRDDADGDGAPRGDLFKPARTTGSFNIPHTELQPAWNDGPPRERPSLMPSAPGLSAGSNLAVNFDLDLERSRPGVPVVSPQSVDLDEGSAPRRRITGHGTTPPVRRTTPTPRRAPRPRAGIGRIVVGVIGWLAAAAAIAVLVYLASNVFRRPDPRQKRRASEAAAAAETRDQAGQAGAAEAPPGR
ncbi:MAG: serine/threonine-protein kinase [Polyangiales bacterium]